MSVPAPELDRGVRQRNHRAAGPEGGERVLAVTAMEPAGYEISACTEDDPVGLGRYALGSIATGTRGVDEGQLVASDEDLGDDHRTAAREPFGEGVDEDVLVVVVQHVGQAGAVEADAAGQALVRRIRDELDLGQVIGLALATRVPARTGGLPQDEPKPRSDRTDHGRRMTLRRSLVPGTKVPVAATMRI